VSAHRSRGIGRHDAADLDITARTDIRNDGFAKGVSGASNDRLASLPRVTRTSAGISGDNGEIDVASLVVDGVKRTEPPERLPPPPNLARCQQCGDPINFLCR